MDSKLKLLLLMSLSLVLISCSSRPYDGKATLSSTDGVTPSPSPSPGTSQSIASCNTFSGASNVVGKVKAYYDQMGSYNSNFVRVRFSGVPVGFGNADNLYIEFYRWRVAPSGAVEQDSTPLRFRLEDPNTLGAVNNTWYGPNGNGTNVGFNRQALYTATSTTANPDNNRLMNFNFLVQGTDAALGYQVLRVALTSVSGGVATNVAYADTLLPLFEANPNTYISTHSATLNQLHPNWSRRLEGWTDANFLAFTTQSCF